MFPLTTICPSYTLVLGGPTILTSTIEFSKHVILVFIQSNRAQVSSIF